MNIIWEYCSDGGWALKKKNMFENAINSKKQGDIGMCYAMAKFDSLNTHIMPSWWNLVDTAGLEPVAQALQVRVLQGVHESKHITIVIQRSEK